MAPIRGENRGGEKQRRCGRAGEGMESRGLVRGMRILEFGGEFWKLPDFGPFCTDHGIRTLFHLCSLEFFFFRTKQLGMDLEKCSLVSTLSCLEGNRKIQL